MRKKPQGSKAGPKAGLNFLEKKRLRELKNTLAGNDRETLWTRTQKADHEMGLLTTNKG